MDLDRNLATGYIGPSNMLIVRMILLTRAPLGYFYNAPHWGGGGYFEPPPLISETAGPILKIQAAFESPGKNCRGKTNFIEPRGHE